MIPIILVNITFIKIWIYAKSELGNGTTFIIELPVNQEKNV